MNRNTHYTWFDGSIFQFVTHGWVKRWCMERRIWLYVYRVVAEDLIPFSPASPPIHPTESSSLPASLHPFGRRTMIYITPPYMYLMHLWESSFRCLWVHSSAALRFNTTWTNPHKHDNQHTKSYNKEKKTFRESQVEYTTTKDMKSVLAHDL
jgi:hypothetical protein